MSTPTTTPPATTTDTAPVETAPADTAPADTIPDDAAARLAPGWRVLSAALTDEAALIADRDDLLVTIAPGAGHGAPACLIPAEAMIEIDGTHLGGLDPATLRPDDPADRARYDTAWGLLVHECAHARHSLWTTPHADGSADDGAEAVPAGAVAAAELLEESKIEAAQIRVRPDDRHWLRASACALIPNTTHTTAADPGAAVLGRAEAASAAALLLARTDGGILTPDETEPVRAAVETALGADTLTELRSLWQAAHDTSPDDGAAMVELGRRWCQALGEDPTTPPPTTTTGCSATGTEPTPAAPDRTATGTDPDAGAVRSPLQQAIDDALRTVAAHVAAETPPPDPAATRRAAEEADDTARTTAERMARRVFTSDADPTTGATAIAGTRPSTPAERASARRIGRALSTAGIRERAATRSGSVLPPGRLRMRGARAADAQRAAGTLFPTAEPFMRTTRTPTPTPPLRVGIACDVSGSMREFADPVALRRVDPRPRRRPRPPGRDQRRGHLRCPGAADHPPRHPTRHGHPVRSQRLGREGRRGHRRPRRRPRPRPGRGGAAAGHRVRRLLPAPAPSRRTGPGRPAPRRRVRGPVAGAYRALRRPPRSDHRRRAG